MRLSSGINNNVYDEQFALGIAIEGVWEQFCKRKKAFNGDRGSSWNFPIYRLLVPATDTLSQTSDVTPVTFEDDNVSISLAEYGNAVRRAVMVEATAFTDTTKAMSKLIAINRAESIELLVRAQFSGGSRVYRPSGVARTSLTRSTAAHLLTDDNLHNIRAMAAHGRMPRMDDGSFAAIIPDSLAASVQVETAWLTAAQYNLGGKSGLDLVTGEIGQLAGVRFVVSPWGKMYWGGGTAAQAATTTTAAVAAGAVQVTVTSATGLAVGNYILVGTKEAVDSEAVQITSIASSPTLDILGIGNDEVSNTGFKFAHASGAAVTEGENVGALILVGPDAVGKVWSSITGSNGKTAVTVPSLAVPERFTDFSWRLIAGYGRIRNWGMIRAEFATPFDTLGYTEALP